MSINDTEYRKAIFNMLWDVKRTYPAIFNELMTQLNEKLERVPTNNFEQSTKFFEEITRSILYRLNDVYDIEHEKVTTATHSQDVFTVSANEERKEMLDLFDRYSKLPRFTDGFLRERNSRLYKIVRNSRSQNLTSCFSQMGDKYVLKTNKIQNQDLFLPKDGRDYMGSRYNCSHFTRLVRTVEYEKERTDEMMEYYEELLRQIEEFDIKIKESLKAETLRFAIKNFKSILSKIVIPVSLLEDEKLRNLCVENGREVFVKRPTFEDLMPIGASVHVYSSHNTEDDSSYIAKPILVSEELPTDTDELKYHGIGQYTMYDNESKRSLDGENPFVINHNVYVKANPEDFNELIPKELLEDIEICEKLVESINKNQETLEVRGSEELTELIDSIQNAKEIDIKKAIESFFETLGYFNKVENGEEGNVQRDLFQTRYGIRIADELLAMGNPNHPYGYVLVKDDSGKHAIIRMKNQYGEVEFYSHEDLDRCCKVGGLSEGIHSVYKFSRLNTSKRVALEKLHIYKPMEDGSNE